MSAERCENCRFVGIAKGLLGGATFFCHRFPPQVIASSDLVKVDTTFPKVQKTWFCGEFRSVKDPA